MVDLHDEFATNWVVGAGASAEHPPGSTPAAQVTLYLDHRWRLDDDWTAKVGAVHYDSPWDANSASRRYNEINAAIGYAGRWRAMLAVSPDSGGAYLDESSHRNLAAWVETTWHQPLVGRLSADLGIGYAHVHYLDKPGYAYGNATLGYGIGAAQLSLARLRTASVRTEVFYGHVYAVQREQDDRWVVSVLWAF
jgi:hypothetical protein